MGVQTEGLGSSCPMQGWKTKGFGNQEGLPRRKQGRSFATKALLGRITEPEASIRQEIMCAKGACRGRSERVGHAGYTTHDH